MSGLVFGLALIGMGTGSCAAGDPNVVLVVVDTLRADRLGCYGYETDTSPAIDELARARQSATHGLRRWCRRAAAGERRSNRRLDVGGPAEPHDGRGQEM